MLRDLDRLSRRWLRTSDGGWQTRILLEILGYRDSGVALCSDRIPTKPLTVPMPPTGRVEVVVQDAAGRRVNATGLVEISTSGTTSHCRSLCARLIDGRAEFAHVALHQELRAVPSRHRDL